ncbi:hypothetical protein G7054_g1417 [Neopestalotiopsis clavispora]|nr:hypothetical protein G7054_g1417 [Neopestalotiopsis clavispora]
MGKEVFEQNPLFHRLIKKALVRHVWGPVYHYAPEYIASFVQGAFSTGPYNRGQLELVCSDLGRIILGKKEGIDILFSLVYNPHTLLVVRVEALEAKGRAIRVKGKPLDQWIRGYKKIVGRW